MIGSSETKQNKTKRKEKKNKQTKWNEESP